MANPHRGDVDLAAGGKTYRLRLDINAIAELEDHTGQSINEIAAALNDPATMRMSLARAVFWGAMRSTHPEVSIKDAGEIMHEAGFAEAMEAVGKAFLLAFPEAEASDSGRPRKAGKAGRG